MPWDCPLCGTRGDRVRDARCSGCGADMLAPEVDVLEQVDDQWRALYARYEKLAEEWTEVAAKRKQLLERLRATRVDPEELAAREAARAAAERAAAEQAAAAQAAAPQQPVAPAAAPVPAPVAAQAAPAVPTAAAAEASAPSPAPRTVTPPRPKKRRARLSAPALLGVSGASLLIAAAIIFVAVTWNTFIPVLQGLILLGVGAAIGALAWWLSRHDLTITAGAVGTVSMAMSGAAVIAAHRGELNFGSFAFALAMLSTTLAGLALAALGVRWVGSAAALTSLGIVVGMSYAVANIVDIDNGFAWALAAAFAGAVLLASLPWWPSPTSRWIIKIGAVAWTGLTALQGAGSFAWQEGISSAWGFVALAPVALLAAAAAIWPRVSAGPLAVSTSALAASIAYHLSDSAWAAATAAAVVFLGAVTGLVRAPRHWRVATLIGLAPAFAATAIAAVVHLGILAVRVLVSDWIDTLDLWSPWPILALGLSGGVVAAWRPVSPRRADLAAIGAPVAIVGAIGAAFAVSDQWYAASGLATGTGLAVVATLAVATSPLWPASPRAPLAARAAGGVAAVFAAVFAASAVADADRALAPSLALALAIPALATVAAVWWQRTMAPTLALTLSLVAPALAQRADLAGWQVAFAFAAAGVVIAALLALTPVPWRTPGLFGLAPSVVVGGYAALVAAVVALDAVAVSVFGEGALPGGATMRWWTAATAATLFAFVAACRWTLRHRGGAGALEVVGAIAAAAAGSLAAADAAAFLDRGLMGVALATTAVAVLVALTGFAWAGSRGRWASGIGGAALMTIAGVYGSAAFSDPMSTYAQQGAVALLPIVLLVVAAARFPRVTLGPAALLATYGAAAVAAHHGGPWLSQVAASAAVVAAVTWAGIRLPDRWRWPLAIGMSPALAVIAAVSVWTAGVGLFSMLTALADAQTPDTNVWAAAAAGLAGVALAGVQHWRLPRMASSIAGFAGTAAVLGGAGSVMYGFSERFSLGVPDATVAATGFASSLLASGFVLLWASRRAKWANGIGAAALMTVAGLHGAAAYSAPEAAAWPGVAVLVGPIVALAAFAYWWPRVTAGPAVFLVGVAALAVGAHFEWSSHATAALAAAVIGAVGWAVVVLPRKYAVPTLAGLAPAAVAGIGYIVFVAGEAAAYLDGGLTGTPADAVARWAPVALGGIVAAAAAVRWWKVAAWVRMIGGGLGVFAAVVGGIAVDALAALLSDHHEAVVTGATLIAALATAATAWLWQEPALRWAVGVAAVTHVTVGGIAAALLATESWGDGTMTWPLGLAIVAAMVAALAVAGTRWPRLTLGSASLLATAGAMGVTSGAGAANEPMLAVVVAVVAAVAWAAVASPARARLPLRLGLVPAVIGSGAALAYQVPVSVGVLGATLSGDGDAQRVQGSYTLVALLALVAALSLRSLRRAGWWIALPVALVVAAALPAEVAWLPGAAAALVAASGVVAGRRYPAASTAHAALAVLWASSDAAWLSLALLVWAGAAVWVSVQDEDSRRWQLPLAQAALAASAGFGAGAIFDATLPAVLAAIAVAAITGFAATLAKADPTGHGSRIILGAASLGLPLLADDLTGAGLALLVAGVGWAAHTAIGWMPGRWVAAAALSLSAACLLGDRGVGVIEAYTVLPALLLIGIGLWWMSDNPGVNSTRGIGPGLLLLLAPTWVMLLVEPDSLVRVMAATLAVLALAMVGMAMRWFAPVLGAAITAIAIAAGQFFTSDPYAPKWVSIAIVGGLLIAMGAAYEKLRQLK